MTTVVVDGCSFTFPATTTVTKYDGWDFYRRFQSHGVKAVDLVVLDSESVLWLVEVKDYTHPDAEPVPFDELPGTVAAKCRDTLAGLAAARFRASGSERTLADRAMRSQLLRIVLHVELPGSRKTLFSRQVQLANLQKKLRTAVHAMGPSPRVHDRPLCQPGCRHRDGPDQCRRGRDGG